MPGRNLTRATVSTANALSGAMAGERPSIFRWPNVICDGVNDDAVGINKAILDAVDVGGTEIFFPGGYTYTIKTPITFPAGVTPIKFIGAGRASVFQRAASMPAGKGMFDIAGSNIRLDSILIDGGVTTSVGVNYSSFAGDPLHTLLTQDTSVWIHDSVNASNFQFTNVVWIHTGGYAALFNATANDIKQITFSDCRFENCRPHVFGNVAGDLNYGSWTGGVLFHGNGTSASCKHAKFLNCKALRCTGNAFWQHSYALTYLHEDINFIGCTGIDIGRDFIQFGGVNGGSADNNYGRRIGYICTDDTSNSIPRWLNGGWGVGIDNSGLVTGVSITNNTLISCNGGYIDADGLADSVVSGNTCRTPRSTDEEYTTDQINTTNWAARSAPNAPSWEYGVQISNTSNARGGESVTVIGNTFINLSGGAMLGYASRSGYFNGNNIDHPAQPNRVPIVLGNIGTGSNQRAYDNVVSANRIKYNPANPSPCVFEDDQGGAFPFQPGDKNWISADNPIIPTSGRAYSFRPNSATQSTTEFTQSSSLSNVGFKSAHTLSREGYQTDSTSSLNIYSVEDTTKTLNAKFQGFVRAGVAKPLFNLSMAGAANSGVVATGEVTTSALDEAVITRHLYGRGFLALTDDGYLDANANILPSTVSLIRWDNILGKWRQSISSTAGVRNWTDFATGGAIAAGGQGQVQFNNSNLFSADASFSYDNTLKLLTITGIAATSSLTVVNGFIHSDGGFLVPIGNTATNAIQAPGGGVTAKWLITTDSTFWIEETAPALSSAGQTRIYMDSGTHSLKVSMNGASYVPLVSAASVAGSNGQIQFNNSGAFGGDGNFIWTIGSQLLTVNGLANTAAITTSAGWVQAADGFHTISSSLSALSMPNGFASAQGYAATSFATTSIQSPNGGVTARYLVATDSIFWIEEAAPALSSPGQSRLYMDSTAHALRISTNGGAYVAFGGASSAAGSNTQVQFNNAGAFGASGNFTYNTGSQLLTVAGVGGTAAIVASTGFIQSSEGFYSANASTATLNLPNGSATCVGYIATSAANTSINSPNGGVSAKLLITTDSSIWVGETQPALSAANQARMYFDSGTLTLKVSVNGGLYAALGVGGVSSLNLLTGAVNIVAGANMAVSAFAGNVTVSLTSNPSVSTLTATTTIQSQSTGANIAFQTANSNIQMNGNGVISSQQLNLGGQGFADSSRNIFVNSVRNTSSAFLIDTSGVFVGAGVFCPGYGIAGAGFNPNIGGVQYFGQNSNLGVQVNVGGTVYTGQFIFLGSAFNNLVIKGGVVVGVA